MLDFLTEEFILTVEVSMAVAIESFYGTKGYVDVFGRPVYLAAVEQARDKVTPVEQVAQTRPPVHEGVLPASVQDLFQETGVFDEVDREEREYQEIYGVPPLESNIIDITTRLAVRDQVYPSPELTAVAGSK